MPKRVSKGRKRRDAYKARGDGKLADYLYDSTGELLTPEFDVEITDQDEFLSMVGAASKRRPASE